MSDRLWQRIADRLNEHEYMAGVERTVERVRATGEIFTPSALVIEMLKYCDPKLFAPGKTILDPACGDGQFLIAVKWLKVYHHAMTPSDATLDLFGVDIMRDNVDLCIRRLNGGTIVMGDCLDRLRELEGQTPAERDLLAVMLDELPSKDAQRVLRTGRVRRIRAEDPPLFSEQLLSFGNISGI